MIQLLALVVLLSLTSWRITSLLYNESPLDWLRERLGIEHHKEMGPVIYPDNLMGKIFDCGWCLSLVITFMLSIIIAIVLFKDVLEWFLLWMGGATGTIMLERWIMRSKARW